MAIAWHAHPDPGLEQLLHSADARALQAALRQPIAQRDRYARLRLLDRLRALLPPDAQLEGAWMQAMLLSNRPGPVHETTRRWPMDRGPDPAWRLIAAQVAQTMGERDEATARFRGLVDTHPGMIDAWQKFFEFDPQQPSEAIAHVQRLHDSASEPYRREKAAFALATVLQRDDPAHAIALLEEAHALKRRRVGAWDAARTQRGLDADRTWSPAPADDAALLRPLFIVGLPRSGTTLLARLLASHPAIAAAGEQNLAPNAAAMVAQQVMASKDVAAWYRAGIGDFAGTAASVVVDKLPGNAEFVGFILATMPDAVVVWLERDLRDCALSIHLRDFEFGCLYADDAADIGRYAAQLREHGGHWCTRVPSRVLPLRYETLVDDPAQALAPILRALGLAWDPAMLGFWQQGEQIATYSEAQVRRPVHRDAVGAWTRFLPAATGFLRTVGEHAGIAIPHTD